MRGWTTVGLVKSLRGLCVDVLGFQAQQCPGQLSDLGQDPTPLETLGPSSAKSGGFSVTGSEAAQVAVHI